MIDLIDSYVAGVMSDDEAAAFEESLFDDSRAAGAAAKVLAVLDGLRAMAAEGVLVPVIHPSELDALARRFRITVHAPVEGLISTCIGDEDYVVARIPVDLSDARRVDVRFCSPEGVPYFVSREVPNAADEVVVACRSHVALTAGKVRLQIVDQDDRLRAEVTLENVPADR